MSRIVDKQGLNISKEECEDDSSSSDSRSISLTNAMHFQRQAETWLSQLRKAGIADGLLPFRCGEIEIDFFDLLRSEMIRANGAALSNLSVPVSTTPRVDSRWWHSLRLRLYSIKNAVQMVTVGRPHARPRGFRRTVLAFPRMAGQLADMLPVAKVLRDDHTIDVQFGLVDRRLIRPIHDEGFTTFGIYSSQRAIRKSVYNLRRQWLPQAYDLIARVGRSQTHFDEEQAAALTRATIEILKSRFTLAATTVQCVETRLNQLDPSLVLVGNPYTLEGRAAALTARFHEIPTSAIEHGSIASNDPVWMDVPCNLVCVWGEPSRAALLDCGVSSEQIAVTGGPRHDAVFESYSQHVDYEAAAQILVATSGPGNSVPLAWHRRFIEILFRAAELTPEISWLVKLHRKDRAEYYEGIPPQARIELTRGEYHRDGLDIFEQLSVSRGLVTIASTAAVDAMALNIPVITVDVWDGTAGMPEANFLQCGATFQVADAKQLAEAARNIWNGRRSAQIDEAARTFAAAYFANRGRASRTVAEKLVSIMRVGT